MFASRQVKIPLNRGIGRRGRGLGDFAPAIGRIALPFLHRYIVLAAKRIAAHLLEFAAPEVAQVVSRRKFFKTAAKILGRKILRKLLGSGRRKRISGRITPTKSAK